MLNVSRIVNKSLQKRNRLIQEKLFPSRRKRLVQNKGYFLGYQETICFSTQAVSENIIQSRFPALELPGVSLTEYALRNTEQYPDRPALINGETGQVYTFSQLKDAIYRVAASLQRHGYGFGDVAMLLSTNSPEFVIMFHAAISVGGIVTTVNPAYPIDDIYRQAVDAGATYMMAEESLIREAKQVTSRLQNSIKKIFVIGTSEGCVPFSDLMGDNMLSTTPDFDPKDKVAMMPYSSGTTGMPKGVLITHHATVANICQFGQDELFFPRDGEVQLGVLPFFHLFALFCNVCMGLAWGQTTVTMRRFNPVKFLQYIHDYKVSLLYAVPPMCVFMSKDPDVKNFDLTPLKRIMVGAAPITGETLEALTDVIPHTVIGQGYGMTESGPMVICNPILECQQKPGSGGVVLPNTEVRIVGVESGQDCEDGQTGEVWARGPQMMKGYLNNPEATAHTLDKDKWLHTGDIGYHDGEGHIYIVDRLKELIKYKGFQVPPAELEALLLGHPAVRDAGVTGIPDPEAGEVPRAYVVLKPNTSTTAQDLYDYVAEHTVNYKRLRGGIEFLDEIPKTPSGKILRRKLRELHQTTS